MSINRTVLSFLFFCVVLAGSGCSLFQRGESVEVMLAGIEPLPSEGLELRMLVKLRVQNPNDKPIDFDGVFIEMDVQDKRFASGISAAAGSVPRYGEAIVNVPVSISALSLVQQAIGVASGDFRGKLPYRLSGKISGPGLGSVRFSSSGELTLPANIPVRNQ